MICHVKVLHNNASDPPTLPCGLPVEIWTKIFSPFCEAHLLRYVAPVCQIFRAIVHDRIAAKFAGGDVVDYVRNGPELSDAFLEAVGRPKALKICRDEMGFSSSLPGIDSLRVALRYNVELERLVIRRKILKEEEVEELIKMLSSLSKLKELELRSSSRSSSIYHLNEVLLPRLKGLTSLTLEYCLEDDETGGQEKTLTILDGRHNLTHNFSFKGKFHPDPLLWTAVIDKH